MRETARSVPRIALVVLVVALVALAGCSSDGGTTTSPGDTTTDAPTTETMEPTTTTTTEDGMNGGTTTTEQMGPGGSVTDGFAEALEAAGSFTSEARINLQTTQQGQEVNVTIDQIMYVDITNEVGLMNQTISGLFGQGSTILTESYTSGDETYQRSVSPFQEGPQYSYATEPYTNTSVTPVNFSQASGQQSYIDQGITWTNEGSTTYEGMQVTRYTAEGVENFPNLDTVTGQSIESVDSVSAELLIDDNKIVRLLQWDISGTNEQGNDVSLSLTFEISNVGSTTVEEPAWTDEVQQ